MTGSIRFRMVSEEDALLGGMMLLDDAIAELVKTGQVTKETARRFAEEPRRFA